MPCHSHRYNAAPGAAHPPHGKLARRRLAAVAVLAPLLALAGCSTPPSPTATSGALRTHWSGRLALQLEGQAAQSFSAAFELDGNPLHGELRLLSPFGNTLVQLDWKPGHARLHSGETTQESSSLEDLLEQATGAAIPVTALFSWLSGIPATSDGWHADLSAIEQGKMLAQRQTPEPRATLRITFER